MDQFQIGHQILAYLAKRPNAGDTIEGIVEWWLLEQKIGFETARVKAELDDLLARGLIERRQRPDSRIHYRIRRGGRHRQPGPPPKPGID